MNSLSRLFYLIRQTKYLMHEQAPTHQLLTCMLSDYGVYLCYGSEGTGEILYKNVKLPELQKVK